MIGSAGFASDLAEELEAAGIRGYEVIGWFGARRAPAAQPEAAASRLDYLGGARRRCASTVLERRIELLVCARMEPVEERERTPTRSTDLYALIADACLDLPVRMIEANQLYEELLGHVPLGTTDSAWFRYIMHPRFRPTSPLWKRCFDLVNAGWMALIALPIVAAAAVAIKLTDGGPVLLPPAAGRGARQGVRDRQAADHGRGRRGERSPVVRARTTTA